MKKRIFLVMLILTALLVGSCGTTPTEPPPPPPPAPAPAPPPPAPAPAPAPQPDVNRHHSGIIIDGAASYTVQSGDTLSGIAWRLYDDGSFYPLIMMVSDEVKDIDEIEPGMILTVPDISRNLNDSRAKSSINTYFEDTAKIEDQRGRSGTAKLIREHIN